MVKKGKTSSVSKLAKKSAAKKKVVKKSTAKKAVKKTTKKVIMKKKVVPKKKIVKKTAVKKKVVKKVPAKKSAKSKSSTKKVVRRTKSLWEKSVGESDSFYTANDKQLTSILSLVKELEIMEDHVYHHHVSFQHNDFANWIEGVFELTELGKSLRESHTKDETQLLLLKYIINNS